MMMNDYVAEKLRELEAERLAALHIYGPPPARKPVFTAIIRATGRKLRRTGERLEAWATPAPAEPEQRQLGRAWRESWAKDD
jgi:hypothetical protein